VISIIDDDASLRWALKRLLQSDGLLVAEFASAEEFLRSGHCQTSACLLLDLQLSGMSGIELHDRLRVSNPQLPIVFMSGNINETNRARAMCSGAIEFLEKPIDEQALFAAIDACLILSRSQRAPASHSGG
jgi:FixJ family two-component response regulator